MYFLYPEVPNRTCLKINKELKIYLQNSKIVRWIIANDLSFSGKAIAFCIYKIHL